MAFLQWVALPALLFRGMAALDFSRVNVVGLVALIASKAVVTASTALLAVLFAKPKVSALPDL